MKKLLLTGMYLAAFFVKAQTNVYHPMPDSSAQWCETWSYGSTACYTQEDYTLFFGGDTLINGNTFHKLFSTGDAYPPNCPYPPVYHSNTYYGAIRQDIAQKKVYSVQQNFGERLEYDFNQTVGDTIAGTYNYVITHTDSMLLSGNYRKRCWVGVSPAFTHADSNLYFITEGVGSSVGLLMQRMQGPESISSLLSFGQDAKAVYPDSTIYCQVALGVKKIKEREVVLVFPNPTTGLISVFLSENAQEIQITNALGEILIKGTVIREQKTEIDLTNSTAGIYFLQIKTPEGYITRKVIKQ